MLAKRIDFPALPADARLQRPDLKDKHKEQLIDYARGPEVEEGLRGPLFKVINTSDNHVFELRALGQSGQVVVPMHNGKTIYVQGDPLVEDVSSDQIVLSQMSPEEPVVVHEIVQVIKHHAVVKGHLVLQHVYS